MPVTAEERLRAASEDRLRLSPLGASPSLAGSHRPSYYGEMGRNATTDDLREALDDRATRSHSLAQTQSHKPGVLSGSTTLYDQHPCLSLPDLHLEDFSERRRVECVMCRQKVQI